MPLVKSGLGFVAVALGLIAFPPPSHAQPTRPPGNEPVAIVLDLVDPCRPLGASGTRLGKQDEA